LEKGLKKYILYIVIALFTYSCSTVKNVPENEYLLDKVVVKSKIQTITNERFLPYIKQKPNVRIVGMFKFHLWLYNLAGKDTSKAFNKWLMRIGEDPVFYDSFLAEQSTQQLALFMKNRGYFHAKVKDTAIVKRKKKVKVRYDIRAGNRFRLNEVVYKAEDPEIQAIVESGAKNSLLKKGRPFDVTVHDAERDRIARLLRNNGYYNFSKDFVYFRSDSTVGEYLVNDSVFIQNALVEVAKRKTESVLHPTYRIKNVFFRMGFDTHKALNEKEAYFARFDTVLYDGYHFLYIDKVKVKPEVLVNSTYIKPGQLFKVNLVERTQALLSGLRLYRFINIRFEEVQATAAAQGKDKWLNCFIQLVPAKHQSYSIDIEGINSSGNLGAGGNLKYQHKNLLRGAEEFSLGVGGSMQNQINQQKENFSTIEVGGDSRIVFPKFWMPFKIEGFRRKYNPKTSLSIAYNYQRRPDYTRTMANGRISYFWNANKRTSHLVSPLGINFVGIPIVDQGFKADIAGSYLEYSYQNHLITNTSYSIVYNEQEINKRKDFLYVNWNVEEAGIGLNLLAKSFTTKVDEGHYEILGVQYAQYIRSDVDIRYHHYLNRINSLAYRVYLGVGYPYGNLNVLPFEKRYFSGGANSVRAWPVRGLGPGSYNDPEADFYNQTGDVKLEANAEYRFKLLWILEGAFFLDAGNVYTIRKDISPEGGLFTFDSFAEKIAVGSGLGLRFDLTYFIFRLDMGLKLRDPIEEKSKRWIPLHRPFNWEDVGFNLAIGYPF
jgi:outer membrane protein assembly factor BamA